MEQTKATNALEPYLALTKSATAPRAAADLITQATSNPNTYVFAELLSAPQIRALSNSTDYSSYLALLEIFSHGTYGTYTSTPNLPPLSDAQLLKLRQLSLLSLSRDPRNLTYSALQQNLRLPDARSVEDLVISAVYAGLVEAQLDPRNGAVHISSVAPLRDLAPASIPAMLSSLRNWSGRCTSTLADLESQIAAIKASAAQRHAEQKAWDATQARLVEEESSRDGSGGAVVSGGVHGRGQSAHLSRALANLRQQQSNPRFGKRGSNSLEPNLDEDEAMDVDEDEPDDGEGGGAGGGSATSTGAGGAPLGNSKKRANRRKL